jgi:hypothetical protein
MSKSFAQAPRPKPLTDDAIMAFERAGLGHDTQGRALNVDLGKPANEAGPVAKEEPIARLSIDLPKSLHRRFKAACARDGLIMMAEVTALIERRTAGLEQAQGG